MTRPRSLRGTLVRGSALCLVGIAATFVGSTMTVTSPAIAGSSQHATLPRHEVKAVKRAPRAANLTLPANVAPTPSFLSSCAAADDSFFCLGQEIEAIDNARAEEGLGAMTFSLSAFSQLPVSEQLFTLTNLERTARGLDPVTALTAQLDSLAAQGAAQVADPALKGWTLSGGKSAIAWNSNWAGGLSTLAANYYWMYSDGPGFNIECTTSDQSGCWAHRKNILASTAGNCGTPTELPKFVMGAATTDATQYSPSDAEIIVQVCGGLPSDTLITWRQLERSLQIAPN